MKHILLITLTLFFIGCETDNTDQIADLQSQLDDLNDLVKDMEDDQDETLENYQPMPVTLDVPSFVTDYLGEMPIPEDNPMTVEGIFLGRKLFYDTRLSDDSTKSCASCHLQSAGFTDPEQFSEGITGERGTRNAMQIINAGWFTSFFWDGRAATLEDQALGPVINPVELNTTWPRVEEKNIE